jgi:hypothetical protein
MTAAIFTTISSLQVIGLRKNHKAILHVKIYRFIFRIAFWFFLIHNAN